jgi:cold shock CspA family protein
MSRFDNGQDVYVHRTNLGQTQQKDIAPSLDEHEEVEFDIAEGTLGFYLKIFIQSILFQI